MKSFSSNSKKHFNWSSTLDNKFYKQIEDGEIFYVRIDDNLYVEVEVTSPKSIKIIEGYLEGLTLTGKIELYGDPLE